MSEHKHTEAQWVKAAESLPKEYEEVYAKHEDGSIRIARLSKSEGGCWQLATFLVDTKRPGYAWPIDKVVEWRPIQPATALSVAVPELLAVAENLIAWVDGKDQCTSDIEQIAIYARAAIAKATGATE